MKIITISDLQLRVNQKVSYWRGFWVGIFIGLVPATFFLVLLNKLIAISL